MCGLGLTQVEKVQCVVHGIVFVGFSQDGTSLFSRVEPKTPKDESDFIFGVFQPNLFAPLSPHKLQRETTCPNTSFRLPRMAQAGWFGLPFWALSGVIMYTLSVLTTHFKRATFNVVVITGVAGPGPVCTVLVT